MNTGLFLTAYFPPIQFYSELRNYSSVYIEVNENYSKQTYRNRCEILGTNGVLRLSMPVIKKYTKTKTKDILIDYSSNWQKNHFKSIESAYRSSPFYEYFIDDIMIFFNKKYNYLIDMNMQIIDVVNNFLGLDIKILQTENFIDATNLFDDFRFEINPKNKLLNKNLKSKVYTQVFSEKLPFAPNLSILDLIFNMGQESNLYF